MPLNERKIIEIISEECAGIDERYNGYREDIGDVITDILIYEQGHRVSKTNIQKDIMKDSIKPLGPLSKNAAPIRVRKNWTYEADSCEISKLSVAPGFGA